jgi:hypothetical protein
MDKAKAAITDFMGKSGHHDTTVHEAVAPAVQHEVIKPHVHEEVNTAIDKEVHQDHYHRTVQPVQDRDVLPEQHTAKLGAVQHREFDHRDHDATKRNLVEEQAQFADERKIDDTTHSQSVAPTVGGEHVHHHIHETIQPVVHKETIQPSVVHTTVPIHEVHHNAAQHHQTSELPAMNMSEFKKQGGVLGGREERYDGFEGEPKHIGGTLKHMMEGQTSKRDSGHAHGLKEGSMHGDYDPIDGGRRNNQNAAGLAGTGAGLAGTGAGLGHSERGIGHKEHNSHAGMGAAGGLGAAGAAAGAGGLAHKEHNRDSTTGARRRSSSSSSDESRRNRTGEQPGLGGKIKNMLSSN